MTPILVNLDHHRPAGPATRLPALIDAIGLPGFLPTLLGLYSDLVGASDLSVFTLRGEMPTLQGAVSLHGHAARRAGLRYLGDHFYRLDSNLAIARSALRGLYVSHLHVADLPNEHYRASCYASAGLSERLSLLIPVKDEWIFVNAYRRQDCPVGTEPALDRLLIQAPVLAATIRQHLAACDALVPAMPVPLADDRLATLSARERQVVQAIVAGHSAKEAGRQLGLSATSVATYRERAFIKLGVRRQVELFRLLGATAPTH